MTVEVIEPARLKVSRLYPWSHEGYYTLACIIGRVDHRPVDRNATRSTGIPRHVLSKIIPVIVSLIVVPSRTRTTMVPRKGRGLYFNKGRSLVATVTAKRTEHAAGQPASQPGKQAGRQDIDSPHLNSGQPLTKRRFAV